MLEAVPNVSEGRDPTVLAAIGEAFADGVTLLDVHSDPEHHRSVFTLVGVQDALVDALLSGIARTCELVDLRQHVGVHPRVGAADVVPLVPFVPEDMPLAVEVARELSHRVGTELGLPVFRYGEIGADRRPAFFRRGGLDGLIRLVEEGELEPDDGPGTIDTRSGVVLVGARAPLVAYNVELATDDVAVARAVAASIRASGGGMPGVQAIGLLLPESGRVQVSMNVIDIAAAPLHEVVRRVRDEAAARGVDVGAGELVGLVPAAVLHAAEKAGADILGVDESRVLENVLRSRLAR